jgi:glutamate synthase (NADPH/NADH) small chain
LIEKFNLKHDSGVVKIKTNSYQTSNQKVFACGDVIFGKGKQGEAMVVSAAQQGKETAYAIHQFLNQTTEETA